MDILQTLEQMAKQLPVQPKWIQIQELEGHTIAIWGKPELDISMGLTAAFNSLCERVLAESENGDFQHSILFGTEGIYIGVRLNEQDILALGFRRVQSFDSLLSEIKQLIVPLNEVLK